YGNDTATAAGYVAALAAILRAGHGNWPARQVVAQEAGSINPVSGYPHTDQLGFGIIQPVQAVSLPPVDPAVLPGFEAMFPVNQAPRTAAPSARSQSATSGSGSGSAPSASAPDSSAAGSAPVSQVSPSSPPAAGTTETVQQWPTGALSTAGPSNVAGTAAGKKDSGGGGVSPVLFIGLLVLVGGGGYVLWQRRQQPRVAPAKPESEWEAPTGPRHSGYSPPDE
ncbi:MAG: hypothetical protein HOV83_10370, partial [Catenulispora sp.]|nr:hypothetical protein [Catenulispora sp.]